MARRDKKNQAPRGAARDSHIWTSSIETRATAKVSHHGRMGGGADPTSWNAARASRGCSAAAFAMTGDRGSIYGFAAD